MKTRALALVAFLIALAAPAAAQNATTFIVLANAARTASTNSTDWTNGWQFRGMMIHVHVSAITATPSVTPRFQVFEPILDDYIDYAVASAPIAATGDYFYVLYPGSDVTEAAPIRDVFPFPLAPEVNWRVRMTHADADSITYYVSGYGLR